ncbi:hypothetical protein JG068_04 [Burkholderia phage JG068]|uniref:Uncharacterized protein n=1 Tax=Burkholderia phage JG068 TaxID=1401297 RepID=U3PDI4_9CAUD|nr:hypothetical protein JG068_04 [Burkholderia phage JG068]AGW43586.1 hypothetical protein JG068_04 [Burkholderia phage JG068]
MQASSFSRKSWMGLQAHIDAGGTIETILEMDTAEIERRMVNWPSVTFTRQYFQQALAAEWLMQQATSFAAMYGKVHGDTVIVDELHETETQHSTAPQCSRLVSALIRRIT